jgi:hypothetical protein
MSGKSQVRLPRGLYDDDGRCHRDAVLRPLTGHEELALASLDLSGAEGALAIDAANELFVGCVERIGGFVDPTPEQVAALSRGDRQHLALHLRARMFGDRLSLVVPCPNPSCRELSDLDLSVAQLLGEPREVPEVLTIETPDGVALVREPTGADDAFVAAITGETRARAAILWSRLVLDLGGRGPVTPEGWTALCPASRGAIALGLAEKGSALDLAVIAPCPSCEALIELEIDPVELVVRELRVGVGRLFAEIHALAWHYHWPEGDILALPRARRWRYLDLIGRHLEGRPLEDARAWSTS